MSRILIWLALVFLVMFAIRSKLRDAQRGGRQFRQREEAAPPPSPSSQAAYQARAAAKNVADAETMLCCAHCGIYYPASETVQAGGRDFCSAAHARLPAA